MSEQPTTPKNDDVPDEPIADLPLEEVPAAAGGDDDTEPAQGEGENDSY